MLQNTTTSNGNKIKQVIKGKDLPALAALASIDALPESARFQDKRDQEKPIVAAIDEYRRKRGYEDNAGIEIPMYFLLQGDVGRGNYSEELRKTRETLIELMALLAHPDVMERMEGYTSNYVGGMLKRLHSFFDTVENDWFLTYMDKQRLNGAHDYEIDAINRTLNIYQNYSGEGPVYVYDAEGMCPKNEYEG